MSKTGGQQQGGGSAQGNMSKLSYRIRSCSSEESTNPVNELLMQSPQSKGWQSARFCDYPQEIVFQFMSPVRIRQLQFLSHQSKISSRIEIFVYMPDSNTPFVNTEFKYRKLGYLSLDANERTGYQSRELKSVYVESPCLYMKLLFHKQHNNKYNMFNQVGLIALSCFGDVLSNLPEKIEQPKEFYNQIQYQTQFDNVTLDRLRTLEAAKDRAVNNEDFEEAKRLKEAIERLKIVGSKLRQLDERKQVAIQNEDYESAKIIKAEIERLRNAVAPEFLVQKPAPLQYNANIPYNQGQFQGLEQDPAPSKDLWNSKPVSKPTINSNPRINGGRLEPLEEEQHGQQQQFGGGFDDDDGYDQNDRMNPNRQSDRQIKPNTGNKYSFPPEDSKQDRIEQQKFKDQFSAQGRNVIANNTNQNHDELVLPALKNPANKKPWEQDDAFAKDDPNAGKYGGGGGGTSTTTEVENLTAEARKLADPLIPVIGEECASKIFSKNWQIREEGIKWLEGEAQNPRSLNGDAQTLFTALAGVCSATLCDKNVQVSQASMSLLQVLCSSRNAKPSSLKGETGGYVDGCLAALVELSGHNLPRVREATEASFFSLGSLQVVGNPQVVSTISKGTGVKPKILSSIKHIVSRLNILSSFSKRFQIGKKDVPIQPVMEFAVKSIVHPNAEVRTAATALIVDAMNIAGQNSVEPYLTNLPEQQRDILEKEYRSSEGASSTGPKSQQTGSSSMQAKKTVVSTNIQHQGARGGGGNATDDGSKGKKGGPTSAKGKQGGGMKNNSAHMEEDASKVCEFCGVYNPEFGDNNSMDIHLWRECPMLLVCSHCAQVIEISSYAKHLSEDCQDARKFRQCPRCKEPVPVSKYNDHVAEKSCLPAQPLSVANRCPLCHTDIDQGPEGWKKHLTVQGCPNNERSAG